MDNTLDDKDPMSHAIAFTPEVPASLHDTQAVRSDEKVVGYKQTEVGVIPSDWSVFTIGELFEYLRTATNSRADLGDAGVVAYVHYGDIHTRFNHFIDFSRDNVPRLLPGKTVTAIRLRDGDLIVTDASEDETGVGKSVEVRNLGTTEAVSGLHTILLRPKGGRVHVGYRGYLLEKESVKKQLRRLTTGLKVFGISKRALTNVRIPLPSTTEQRNIAEVLSDVDRLLTALEGLIAKKRTIKRVAMQQILTGKTRLPGFSRKWSVVKLADLGVFRSGNGFPLIFQRHQSGDYPFFKVSDINNEGNQLFLQKANHRINEDIRKILGATLFPAGSIVFAKIGAAVFLERKRLLSQESCLDNNMMAFSLTTPDAIERFLYYLFLRIDFSKFVFTTALPSLSSREIGAISVLLPPLEEQRAIASVLSDIDSEISALELRRQKIRAVNQSMKQLLLTGRVRLIKPD